MLPALRIAVSKPQMRLPDKERDHLKQLLLILLFAVVCFNPETRLVFSSNGERTVTVIRQESPDKYSVLETVKTAPGARTMALDLKTHKIFLPLADSGLRLRRPRKIRVPAAASYPGRSGFSFLARKRASALRRTK